MSGDRLAEIEREFKRSRDLAAPDVLALVEIAKAAREVNETLHLRVRVSAGDEARLTEWGVQLNTLNAALARLDSGAAEGDA